MAKWESRSALGSSNQILEGDGFYISFNADLSASVFGASFGSDNGDCETALVKGSLFYILNGDWRTDYERLVPDGFKACLAFFREKEPEHVSEWTSSGARATESSLTTHQH